MVTLPEIPSAFEWAVKPADWDLVDGALSVDAGRHTDIFVDPADGTRYDNAPRLLTAITGDFQLSARVEVDFVTRYDAGALLLWQSDDHWAKLCFELSPQGRPTIVSVVNRGVSDDANSWTVDGDSVWLRVSRSGDAYAFHASADGGSWHLVRYFTLGGDGAEVGFGAQSPHGPGCRALFDDIRFSPIPPADPRDGS